MLEALRSKCTCFVNADASASGSAGYESSRSAFRACAWKPPGANALRTPRELSVHFLDWPPISTGPTGLPTPTQIYRVLEDDRPDPPDVRNQPDQDR